METCLVNIIQMTKRTYRSRDLPIIIKETCKIDVRMCAFSHATSMYVFGQDIDIFIINVRQVFNRILDEPLVFCPDANVSS